jgi:hypothetical protein
MVPKCIKFKFDCNQYCHCKLVISEEYYLSPTALTTASYEVQCRTLAFLPDSLLELSHFV